MSFIGEEIFMEFSAYFVGRKNNSICFWDLSTLLVWFYKYQLYSQRNKPVIEKTYISRVWQKQNQSYLIQPPHVLLYLSILLPLEAM